MRIERINNPVSIDKNLIETELRSNKHVIVQFSDRTYNDALLHELNELSLRHGENFGIRFYGYSQDPFDCKVLTKIPQVKCLYVDCLQTADNVSVLTELQYLQKLHIGIFELQDTEILGAENFTKLKEFTISDTKTKGLNLEYLKNYKHLSSLGVCGHTKNIDTIGALNTLRSLSLHLIGNKIPVDFVNKLKNLDTLRFMLGGRENINEIDENEIKRLEIVRVRGFKEFKNISKFKKLNSLHIEDQIQLTNLDFDPPLEYLEDVKLLNCKTLSTLNGLGNLASLKHLRVYKTNIDFDTLIQQPLPKSLDIFAFYTEKAKVDKAIYEKLKNMGYRSGLE